MIVIFVTLTARMFGKEKKKQKKKFQLAIRIIVAGGLPQSPNGNNFVSTNS